MLIAVYGSLRKGLGNHHHLKKPKVKYVGTFDTKPIYTMKSLVHFPALLKNGSTSIVMEVYKIPSEVDKAIENLEGYQGKDNDYNMYNKEKINTPFGEAFVYFWNKKEGSLSRQEICPSGDWKEYLMTIKSKPHA